MAVLILPVSVPQNMVDDTFAARDFAKTGFTITVAAYLMAPLPGATCGSWPGYV